MHYLKIIATITGCLIAANAMACGESLFRVGKGVGFREYTAPLPGSILVVAKTQDEIAMVERLSAAGHDIHVVSDPSQIGQELATHEIDIVLAYYNQADDVESQMASGASATFIPVAQDGTTEVSEASKRYQNSLSNEDSVLQFLKTIHKTLKTQG